MEDSLGMGLEVRNAGVAAQSTALTGPLGPNWTRPNCPSFPGIWTYLQQATHPQASLPMGALPLN